MKTSSRITNLAAALILLGVQRTLAGEPHVEVVQTGTNFTYTVFNDELAASTLYLDAFRLQVRAPFDVVSSPAGWVFETDNFTYVDWACTNEVPPYPQDIVPGGSLTGFGLRSKVFGTETNSVALTTWDHGSDTYGAVSMTNVVTPAILGFDASLTNAFYSSSNTFHVALNGIPSFSYAVQSSSNLINWASVVTNSTPFTFEDTNKATMRFYRSVFVPDASSWPVLGD